MALNPVLLFLFTGLRTWICKHVFRRMLAAADGIIESIEIIVYESTILEVRVCLFMEHKCAMLKRNVFLHP
jgi:hypothetical protein